MNLELYLESQSFDYRNVSDTIDLSKAFFDLDNVRDAATEVGDYIRKSDGVYDIEILPGIKIYEVIYCDAANDKLTAEERKLLRLLIDHIPTVEEEEYELKSIQINNGNCEQPSALIGLKQVELRQLFVSSTEELIGVRRFYLSTIRDEKEFLHSAPMCFPNIYFHPCIEQTMKQLSAPLPKFIHEIIYHLSSLNDTFPILFELHRKENMDKVLEVFTSQKQIAASMQGSAKEAKERMTFTFTTLNGEEIDIVCEPHTKLEGTGAKGDKKYRFDRIYFHPGLPHIEHGKVLVAHIGKHR